MSLGGHAEKRLGGQGQQGASVQGERLVARPRGQGMGWLDWGRALEEAEPSQ